MTAHFSLQEIVQATGGVLRQGRPEARFVGLSTDSRTAQAGQIFLPLPGERFDGHDFIGGALRRGVGAVVVSTAWARRNHFALPRAIGAVLVPDTLQALGDLANFWRRRFRGPVVAITGSCGKTTTKEMIAKVLANRYRVLKNEMNLNNLIGMPLTLLDLSPEHQVAVVECGMNRFGEIRRLAQIAQPDIAVLTNVHPAHLAGVGCLAGVARAKTEMIDGLRAGGTVIYNFDDLHLRQALSRYPGRTLSFGLSADAELRALEVTAAGTFGQRLVWAHQQSRGHLLLQLPGLHQIYNALAALAVGLTLGLAPEQMTAALATFQSPEKRSQVVHHESGIVIYNDCYNANPGSMRMALETLAAFPRQGRIVAALGDMLELGEATAECHREIGALAARLGVDLLVVYGQHNNFVKEGALAAGLPLQRLHDVSSHADGARIIKEFCRPGDILLVKGSRGARMEKLLQCL
ncbi:MAG: UDP-N-acetylmuramoyl-tripeptide--D-alanyl-D-alanine ligase [Desulfobacca sp.]|uniref:UDP-N-acetylmuramoyl-tripeptide--D-alanyl-D- alanine ligase n=1 Tax=Desulfobacca sp. TaxID=2067990 RepID=UPI00404AF52B